jgi:small subunit ribosomal protein S7
MPRRARAPIRPVEPDSRHRSRLVQQVINKVMTAGKKSLAERITYDALAIVGERSGREPVEVLEEAIKELTPSLEVRSRRVGGATYQVPVEVRTDRRQALGIRWLIIAARERNEKTMTERLSAELLDASNNRGNAVKKREDTHRMAEANRAFSHYRW